MPYYTQRLSLGGGGQPEDASSVLIGARALILGLANRKVVTIRGLTERLVWLSCQIHLSLPCRSLVLGFPVAARYG